MELLRQYFMEEKFSFHVCFLCFSGGCGLCAWTCRFVSTFMLFIHILHAKLMFYDCCSRYAIRASYHLCGWCSASPELWWDLKPTIFGLVWSACVSILFLLCFPELSGVISVQTSRYGAEDSVACNYGRKAEISNATCSDVAVVDIVKKKYTHSHTVCYGQGIH